MDLSIKKVLYLNETPKEEVMIIILILKSYDKTHPRTYLHSLSQYVQNL